MHVANQIARTQAVSKHGVQAVAESAGIGWAEAEGMSDVEIFPEKVRDRDVYPDSDRDHVHRPLSLLKCVFVIFGAMFAFGFAECHSVWGAFAPETIYWSGANPMLWLTGWAAYTTVMLALVVAQVNAHLDAVFDKRSRGSGGGGSSR